MVASQKIGGDNCGKMALKVVHINRDEIAADAEARELWETVLKPKWEQWARERGAKLRAELRSIDYPKDHLP